MDLFEKTMRINNATRSTLFPKAAYIALTKSFTPERARIDYES
jgi:hypothetical protein